MNLPSNQALMIFIKNPELGKVKTRLAKTIGDERALKVYHALLAHTREVVLQVDAHKILYYSGYKDMQDDWSNDLFEKRLQSPGDLGQRMHQAFETTLKTHRKVLIIGSDCPKITPQIINQAYLQLADHDFVLGPALDGGYYLLGMNAPEASLFEHIPWSTDQVKQQTINRMSTLGKSYALLPSLPDIDYESDWKNYGWPID